MTAAELDQEVCRISSLEPSEDLVLSGYLNRDDEGRDYLEQRLRQLRARVPAAQKTSFQEAWKAIPFVWNAVSEDSPALAFFIRGGRRMLFRTVPYPTAVTNRVSAELAPCLYQLCEVRDDLDHFLLLHLTPDRATLAQVELGAVHSVQELAAGLPLVAEKLAAKLRCDRTLRWILAGERDRMESMSRTVTREVRQRCIGMLDVESTATIGELSMDALRLFRRYEEAQSQSFARSLLRQGGERLAVGAQAVLRAAETGTLRALALSARTQKNVALRWLRQESGAFRLHDETAFLASRSRARFEVVESLPELEARGGVAALVG
jgi:hypothetical protein